MKRIEFLQYLQANGCALIREGGRHSWWGNIERNTRSAIPRHREINDLVVRKTCKELDIPPPA